MKEVEPWMRAGQKVAVGIFEGEIRRVWAFDEQFWLDVEICGVVTRYNAKDVVPIFDEEVPMKKE